MRARIPTRRLGLFLLGGCVAASLLTGCGGGTESATGTPAQTGDTPVASAPLVADTPVTEAPGAAPEPTPEPAPMPTPDPAPVATPLPRPTVGSAALSWEPPTQNADGSSLVNLAGYRIYYGTDSQSLDKAIHVSNPGLTSYTIGELPSGTYYFAVTVYNTDGTESEKSTLVSKTI